MKKENIGLYVLRLAGTLLLITAVVAAALAGINAITAPKIQQLNWEKTQAAVDAVLPGGGEEIYQAAGGEDAVRTVYGSDAGYAVNVVVGGFDGDITMMVGIDKTGKVLGISIISQSETAGLGAVCAASTSAGEAFRGQFIGMSGSLSVTKDGGQVDAITSATITSRAVTAGVNAALEWVSENS